ncbi:winged helix-turn-helix domain-containing protein [Agrococcus sp. SL85]|uniref:ArsR/SmtB family transcription factor n=1 Tax=Agrococcus sp. SL85 TaxID=2995141 RepID=UPI00226C655C|nr:winged helix-turn-helix domain-containing protein [Agrococcus sp. SL85]WAC66463.1 winged helix-turn-helix domain-containing protein [Agrococcus sp. SL85]
MTDAAQPGATELTAKARALASPLRWRILRLCLHEPRTNKELAGALGMNPGSMHHHVQSLVEVGFLVAEEPRAGARGAKEIPYRATGLTWHGSEAPLVGPVLVQTFLEEIQGVQPGDLEVSRLGVRLSAEDHAEYERRAGELLEWLRSRDSAEGDPWSFLVAAHPDVQQRRRDADGAAPDPAPTGQAQPD